MKTLLVALAATGLAVMAFPQSSDAHSKKYHKYGKSHGSYRSHRRYSKRDYDRLPLNRTNAPNTGAYQYRDFPLWAARAFAPNDGTR